MKVLDINLFLVDIKMLSLFNIVGLAYLPDIVQFYRPMKNKRKTKDFNPYNCGVTHFLNKVGGKWKVLVIHGINMGYNRFSVLQKAIPHVSKQMLINQLRELEEDKIIERTIFAEIPPRVEYRLTTYGMTLLPLIVVLQEWGLNDLKNSAI